MPEMRVGVEPKEESTQPPIKVEIAPSARSTCRITNEKIPKGDPRVVCEAYIGGRITNIYAAVRPFLEGCRVEECTKANSGICRQTRHKFEKGEVRFVGHVGDKKKVFLTLAAAAELLPPVFEAADAWDPVKLQGVDALDSNHIEEFCSAFKVDKKTATGLKANAPAPKDPEAKSPPRKRQKKDTQGSAVDTTAANDGGEASEPAAKQPAAKKPAAKRGAKAAAADVDAEDSEAAAKPAGKQSAAKKPKTAARKPAAKRGRQAVKKEEEEDEEVEEAGEEDEAEGAAAADASAEDEVDAKEEEDGEELPPGQDAAAEEASPERAQPPTALLPGSPNNDYEKARRDQIRRNLERMQELNVVGAAAKVAPAKREKPPKARGLPARRRVKEDAGPRRASLRQQGVAADGTRIDHEKRNGEVVLVNGEAIRYGAGAQGGAWEAPPPRDRHPKAPREVTWSGQPHTPRAPWTCQVGNATAAALRAVEQARAAAAEDAAEPDAAAARHPEGPVEFRCSNGTVTCDARYVQLLAMQTATADGGSKAGSKGKAKHAPGRTQRSELLEVSLAEEDVAKVTRDGVVHMAFHPRSDAIILAAGDKGGRLGIWHLDHDSFQMPQQPAVPPAPAPKQPLAGRSSRSRGSAAEQQASTAEASEAEAESAAQPAEEAADGDGGDDGILELQPHYQYISGLRWVGGAGMAARLLTVSYDGSLRCMDPGAGCTFQLLRSEEGAEYSAMDATADGNTAFLADKDGALEVLDTRQAADAKPAAEISLHEKKINTLSLEPRAEHLLATGVGDGTVAVWDVRKLKQDAKPVASAGHNYSCQAAFFAPDGSQRIVSTSRDNTLQVWDAQKSLERGAVMKHNNNTGRWISPFRAVWAPAADAIVVGNMGRQVDIFDDKGQQAGAHISDLMTAIPSRCCMHTSLPLLAAATASGRVHVFR